jgi:hypothetical protein
MLPVIGKKTFKKVEEKVVKGKVKPVAMQKEAEVIVKDVD